MPSALPRSAISGSQFFFRAADVSVDSTPTLISVSVSARAVALASASVTAAAVTNPLSMSSPSNVVRARGWDVPVARSLIGMGQGQAVTVR
jgi:hypothetical protein